MDDLERDRIKLVVQEVLESLGFDTEKIHETQADMSYLRRIRRGSEALILKIFLTMITVGVSTNIFLIWTRILNKQ